MKIKKTKNKIKNGGLAALLLVIIISVSSLILVLNLAYLGIGEGEMSLLQYQDKKVSFLTEGCVESVISEIRKNSNYGVGQGEIQFDISEANCLVSIEDNLNNRIINATGTVDVYTNVLEIDLTILNRSITINSWKSKDF